MPWSIRCLGCWDLTSWELALGWLEGTGCWLLGNESEGWRISWHEGDERCGIASDEGGKGSGTTWDEDGEG